MHTDIDNVEARVTAGHLHRDLRPLLLFGYLLETDLNAGQFLEFLLVAFHHIATRRELEINLDLRALGLLPVESGLRIGAFEDGGGSEQAGGRGQQLATTDHGSLPECALRRVAGD